MADKTFCLWKPEKKWKSSCKPEEKWETFCRHIKVMRENVFLNISYEKKYFPHKYKKLIIIYNFDKDKINIENEKELFEKHFKEFDLIESGQLLTDQNWDYLTYNEWIEFKNNFNLFLNDTEVLLIVIVYLKFI